jgi:hypothetical protein
VMLADSVLLIALDCFLGKDFKPYQSDGLPLYKAERMIPEQIVPECMRTMINAVFPADPSALTLLDQMIDLGKRQYLLNAFLPGVSDELRMEYSADQLQWIKKNESHVWAAIIENRMLYSSDSRINRVFLSDGPCTQEFGKDSPPRLGEWIGLQVIRSFTDRNSNITLRQLLSDKSAQQILVRSGYKPGR